MKPYTGKLPSLGGTLHAASGPCQRRFFSLLYESHLELYLFLSALARTARWCGPPGLSPTNLNPLPRCRVGHFGDPRPPVLRPIISRDAHFLCQKGLKTAEKSLKYNYEHMPKILDKEGRNQ
jgi:hypothetical protein